MVTIRTYFNVSEAGFAHSLLESRGMHPFLQGENAFTLESIGAMGGIRLQVPEDEAAESKRMLEGEGFAPLPDDFIPPVTDADETEHPQS